MTFSFPFFRRLMLKIQCFTKRRYGYLDPSFYTIPEGKEALFLILSPHFYRISIANLPVATPQEALRYAPSYFDLHESSIVYGAHRLDEGRYLLSACYPEPIRKRLEEAGIEPSSITRFVLSQEAFATEHLPIILEENSALAHSEGIVVQLSASYVLSPIKKSLSEVLQHLNPCLEGFKISLRQGGIPTKKTLIVTAVLSALISLNFIVQALFSATHMQAIEQAQEKMKTDNHLPSTQMELDALMTSWEKKESEQIKLRKILAAFSTLSLKNSIKPPAAAPLPATQGQTGENNIVLVPGSNPSERNLLLVPGAPTPLEGISEGEYLSAIEYENGLITFKVVTPSKDRAESVRTLLAKILKTNTLTIKEKNVEGSVQ